MPSAARPRDSSSSPGWMRERAGRADIGLLYLFLDIAGGPAPAGEPQKTVAAAASGPDAAADGIMPLLLHQSETVHDFFRGLDFAVEIGLERIAGEISVGPAVLGQRVLPGLGLRRFFDGGDQFLLL